MISVDSARVRGEGGLLAPMIVIPMTLELDQRPASEQLALSRLEVALWLTSPGSTVQLGPPVVAFGDGANGGIWTTRDTHRFETQLDLRFTLNQGMLRIVEETVHSLARPDLSFTLKIRPAVGRVTGTHDVPTAVGPGGQEQLLGTAYQIYPMAWPTVDHLDIRISWQHWADMAKDLGLDEVRLIAVRLPRKIEGFDPELLSLYDQAISRYEKHEYREAIGICRDVRNLLEKAIGATKSNPVSAIMATERGVDSSSPPIRFVDQAWRLFAEFTNAARHDESIGSYSAADARAMLLFTSVMLEYLASALGRRL